MVSPRRCALRRDPARKCAHGAEILRSKTLARLRLQPTDAWGQALDRGLRGVENKGVTPVPDTAQRLVVLGTRPPEPTMSLPRTVAEVIDHHVTLELESLDRVYLNVY